MHVLLFAIMLGALSPTPMPPTTRGLTVVVRDMAGRPVPSVTLEVTGATVSAGVTTADGAVRFAVAEDALTITDAHHAGRALLLDRTSAAGLRVPVADVPITLELWLADDQLFVPPAGGGPIPGDLAESDARGAPAIASTAARAVATPTVQPLDVDPPPMSTAQDYAERVIENLPALLVPVVLPLALLGIGALVLLMWRVYQRSLRRRSCDARQ